MNLYDYEKKLLKLDYKNILGVDEVGRGPLCGDVVVAGVILDPNNKIEGLNDSKKLSEKKMKLLYEQINEKALYIDIVKYSPKLIDEYNIYQATKFAMKEVINNAIESYNCDSVLIDAMPIEDLSIYNESIIKGDTKSASIAAASIIAKVTRDNDMYELAKKYPMYGFEKHKGYPTKLHLENIQKYGLIENIYRCTYKPVKKIIDKL